MHSFQADYGSVVAPNMDQGACDKVEAKDHEEPIEGVKDDGHMEEFREWVGFRGGDQKA